MPRPPLDAPDAAWAVYADERCAQGDPRGELIGLHALPRDPQRRERERALLRDERLSGPGGVLATLDARWRHGYLESVRAPTLATLAVLLRHESGALLDELVLDNPHLPIAEQLEVLARVGHPTLRGLTVRADASTTAYVGPVPLGPALRLPRLREVTASVHTLALSSQAPRLAPVLERLSLSARRLPLPDLWRWSFPSLRELELTEIAWQVDPRAQHHLHGARPTLSLEGPLPFPSLERLVLAGLQVDASAAQVLHRWLDASPRLTVDLRACSTPSSLAPHPRLAAP